MNLAAVEQRDGPLLPLLRVVHVPLGGRDRGVTGELLDVTSGSPGFGKA
jgi:hypothetical protein